MNYTGTKARTVTHHSSDALPLPRFQLPNEDPLDFVPTEKRQSVSAVRARQVLRAPEPPDSTQDIAVEDILLEAYADPPPSKKKPEKKPEQRPTIPPPPRANSHVAVEELLESALRAAPPPPPAVYHAPPVVPQIQTQTPSVAPVALPSYAPPPVAPRKSRSLAFPIACVLVLAFGVGAGAALVTADPHGVITKARAAVAERARVLAAPRAPEAAPPPPPPAAPAKKVETPAPVAEPAPSSAAGVPVDALPKPTIEPDMTLVTFPDRARGHRIYVDKVVLKDASRTVKIKCGKRTIKIGSAGRARSMDLPCGGELSIP